MRTRIITIVIVKCFLVQVALFIGFSLCMAGTSDDPNYAGMVDIGQKTGLTVYYSTVSTDSGATALSIKAVYQGLAWLGIGVNPSGEMIGGEAVIGQPNAAVSSENPGKYSMSDESASGVVLMGSSSQTLINGSISQDTSAGTTTLMYTKIMEESGELSIDPNGKNTFIWAIGSNNNYPSYHGGGRGTFVLDLSANATTSSAGKSQQQQESTKNYTKIFAAHGIMAVIAWAFLTPFAVASSFLRSLFPSPLWFKLHMYLNGLTFVLTLTTFILAAVNIERTELFSDPHFVVGWVIMGLVTIQVLGGIFRPHVESAVKPETVWEGIVRYWNALKGGSIRAIWEAAHKLLGFGILGLALWQMQSGLKLWKENFGTQDYLAAYWLWIYFLLVLFLLLKVWAFRTWSKNPQRYRDVNRNIHRDDDEL